MKDTTAPRSVQYEAAEDQGRNFSPNDTIGDIIADRLSRRDLIGGTLAVAAISTTISPLSLATCSGYVHAGETAATSPFSFTEIDVGSDETHHVAKEYNADILIRWGDKVLADAPDFNPHKQTAGAQTQQFGYNNDFIGYWPLETSSDHGLLCINHEYTNEELMFPGLNEDQQNDRQFADMTPELIAIEMAAHGGSVIEIERKSGTWSVVKNSKYARRITAQTEMRISGPAAGHDKMKTQADPTGTIVKGMLNNCAGAMTPWGTWLTCEENFNGYFWNEEASASHPDSEALDRYGIPGMRYAWGKFHERFDIGKEPNECNRFGWVVEIDPSDPNSVPVKRTALGRFKHEGAGNIINKDGRFVIYQGDDQRFDYIYKFVTEEKVTLGDKSANEKLLDRGTLYVARFNTDGSGTWLPLIHGEGPLTPDNGFADQGEVVINARLAADLLGATKMDRPEDIDVNKHTGKAYVMLTKNTRRTDDQVDTANPTAFNKFGHIIEIIPDRDDHAAMTFRWDILLKCGDPNVAAVGATFNPNTSANGWFANPDNCAIDAEGRLWIATDGNSQEKTGRTDGVWALETEGPGRGTSKLFFRAPVGAEICGPEFTPNMETFFVAIQHPGEGNKKTPSSFSSPRTRWPDFDENTPPRPAIVAITRKGGGKIAV